MPVLEAAARGGRAARAWWSAPTRLSRAPAGLASTSSRIRCGSAGVGATALMHDGGAIAFPASSQMGGSHRLQCRTAQLPDRRGRLFRGRGQAARREPQDPLEIPALPVLGDVRAGARLFRAFAVDQRRIRSRPAGTDGARAAARSAGRHALRRPPIRWKRPARRGLRRPRAARPDGQGTWLALFVCGDNLRKGGGAERVLQIAELLPARARGPQAARAGETHRAGWGARK